MARWRLIPVLFLILFASACKKEADIAKELETGALAGSNAYQLLAAWTTAEEFAFGRWEQFASKQIKTRAIDSLYTDGDGVVYEMDFSNGIVCADGIKRIGKCTVLIGQENFPVAGQLVWKSDTLNPFAFLKENKRIELKGSMTLNVFTSDSSWLTFDMWSAVGNDTFHNYTETGRVHVIYEQPIQANRKATNWTGMWSMSHNNAPFAKVTAKKLQNHGACFSLWNSGSLSVLNNKNEAYELNVDPYSTGACDLEFTVSKGKGLGSKEMVFKAW